MAKAKKMSTSFMYPVYSTLYYLTSYTFIWAHLSGSEVSFYLHVVTCFSERTPCNVCRVFKGINIHWDIHSSFFE